VLVWGALPPPGPWGQPRASRAIARLTPLFLYRNPCQK
jgi:hypothetical protein